MIRLEITPFAQLEVKDVVRYYVKEASPAIPGRFRDEFRDACRFLAENPDVGSLRFAYLLSVAEIRTWSPHRFPFRLFYIEDGDVLRVLAVDHERRNVTPSLFEQVKRGS
ncbi:type II toxin-antitoxin system RelE/ParE family toxin [Glaciimonas sp. Gout2]|uniref:type II toxin-antitoxin system RelE/ParE family toxin n=1 Tax=unclassified Glaciimonas TaxID=2644401 RepID=UPI002B222F37|nr:MULTISPECIES: type II toxin-antitoxin system RelE/ParE family toxin [unclassified Glaciimonas]MEB0013188.1 type II toxin-antitoxin system RelE/ParE family toxin [Glaciimonas sp. Cout2]MEB0081929.1 type II toxin-antitoxin system RelE/ParE family toxin [Glaciimonas sp. Gout2]